MKPTVQLSAILTTHGDPNHFHALLKNLLSFENGRFEVIIIHDGSETVMSRFIESEIRKSSNERVFLYEHKRPAGRGASLNEGLLHAEGDYIWAPLRAERLNESLLLEALQRFKSEPVAFWSLDYSLPGKLTEWISAADEGELPDDSCLLWNRNVIERENFFFNPFLESLHGAELAMRISQEHSWVKTDPFFVVTEDQSPLAGIADMKELVFSALRLTEEKATSEQLMASFATAEQYIRKREEDDLGLFQARQHLAEGNPNKSLELVERYLKRNPENQEGLRIKISSLEKLRRHVEAAELKHRLFRKARAEVDLPAEADAYEALSRVEETSARESEPEGSEASVTDHLQMTEEPEDREVVVQKNREADEEAASAQEHEAPSSDRAPLVSVVIPTTAHGKSLLEGCLVRLEEAVRDLRVELIIVDNASLDDTFDYLEQLTRNKFLNVKVIVNQVNKGFPAALNQGFDLAKGDYILFMHNDLLPESKCVATLMETLEASEEADMALPLLSETENRMQLEAGEAEEGLRETELADSCCFMVRGSLSVRFDEEFRPCFFEMEDFCREVRSTGRKILVQPRAKAVHSGGSTSRAMALHLDSEQMWSNRARYRKKWFPERTVRIAEEGSHAERFRRLGAPLNPLEPDAEWLNTVRDYLTSEVRTEILRGSWNEEELFTIMLTLLIADERELLRTLEERLDGIRPDSTLLKLFILYYYRKNIYSRCRHYIRMADQDDPEFELFQLRMLISEKEYERAIPLLNELLALYPSSPELYSHAAEIYRQNREEAEAESFYAMAHQLHPVKYRHHAGGFTLKV